MSYPLNGLTTADDYTSANTQEFLPHCVRLNLTVQNAAMLYSLKDGMGNWLPEVQVPAGSYVSLDREFWGIRIKSATKGAASKVSMDCLVPQDIQGGSRGG